MEENEVELIDYLNILWKRKWMIIIGTLLCMVLTAIVSLMLKPVYEVDAIIQPGKFIVENQSGNFEEVVVELPQQIADKIKHKSYDVLIAAQLNLDEEKLPDLKAENIRETLLTRIWLEEEDVQLGKQIMQALLDLVKKDIDSKIEIEFNNIDSEIKAFEIDQGRRVNEIEILKNKLKIIDQRKKDIASEMKSVKIKIAELEKEQMAVLKKENRSDIEGLGLLLYSNEIQQSLRYYDLLNEKLKNERLDEENVQSERQKEEAAISQMNNNIANLTERKGRIDRTKVVKEPKASVNPVFPNKKINVLIAAIVGFSLFTFLAFFINYIDSKKKK